MGRPTALLSDNNDRELGASLSTPSRHGLFHSRTRTLTLTLTKGRIWELRTFILFLQRSPRAGPKCLGISNIAKGESNTPKSFSYAIRHLSAFSPAYCGRVSFSTLKVSADWLLDKGNFLKDNSNRLRIFSYTKIARFESTGEGSIPLIRHWVNGNPPRLALSPLTHLVCSRPFSAAHITGLGCLT